MSFLSKRGISYLTVALAVFVLCGSLPAADLYVPGNYSTIQDAVDNANAGDSVIVSSGVYNESVDFKGKAITVKSANGAASTTIDANNGPAGFLFQSNETGNSEVVGFTISNGASGIYCAKASPTIRECVVTGNLNGFYLWDNSSPTVDTCTVSFNSTYLNGAGFFIKKDSSPMIRKCKIEYNSSTFDAGGIYCNGSCSPTIDDCTIEYNTGGGISLDTSCSPTIKYSTISNNISGCGIHMTVTCSPYIEGCTIENNDGAQGGGLYAHNHSDPYIRACNIKDNTGAGGGGGIYFTYNCLADVEGCTIEGNMSGSGGGGGGVYMDGGSAVNFKHCIFRDNDALGPHYTTGGGAVHASGSDCTFTECLFSGNTSADVGGALSLWEGSPILRRCRIESNTAGADGGAIYAFRYTVLSLTNCWICDNFSPLKGGGLYAFEMQLDMANCTVANNQAQSGGGLFLDAFSSSCTGNFVNGIVWGNAPESIKLMGSMFDVDYSDVEGGFTGLGNIDLDPLFAGPTDWHIQGGSPCVDAGTSDTQTYPNIPSDDIDGDSRPIGAGYDMGADECSSGPPPFTLTIHPDPLVGGQNASFVVANGKPNAYTWLGYSYHGPGTVYLPKLNVTIGIRWPKKAAGPTRTNASGAVTWDIPIPSIAGLNLWIQACQVGQATNVVATSIQ